jgi:hypothetical protein
LIVAYWPVSSIFCHRTARAMALTSVLSTWRTATLNRSDYFFEKQNFLGLDVSLVQAFEDFIALWLDGFLRAASKLARSLKRSNNHLLVGMRALDDAVPLDAMEALLGTP